MVMKYEEGKNYLEFCKKCDKSTWVIVARPPNDKWFGNCKNCGSKIKLNQERLN